MRANYAGFHKIAGVLALSASFFLLSAALGRAQIVSDGNPDQTINLSVSNADKVEAGRATSIGKKMILPPKNGIWGAGTPERACDRCRRECGARD